MLVVVFPVLAAILWGTFAVVDDPSRSGQAPIPVAGWVRLRLELAFFALAAFALYQSGNQTIAAIFGAVVALHYLISYDRVIWLLQQSSE